MNKIGIKLTRIFSILIFCCLIVSGLTFFGYLLAFVLSGAIGEAICLFIFKTLFVLIIRFASIVTLIGLIGMYLTKQTINQSESKKKS